jgi:hypothetical protein
LRPADVLALENRQQIVAASIVYHDYFVVASVPGVEIGSHGGQVWRQPQPLVISGKN